MIDCKTQKTEAQTTTSPATTFARGSDQCLKLKMPKGSMLNASPLSNTNLFQQCVPAFHFLIQGIHLLNKPRNGQHEPPAPL